MRDRHDNQRFRDFASLLLPEIDADDRTFRSVAEKVGASPSLAKQVGGWLLEKASRLKLGHTGSTDFDMFESLEFLALGIHGKLCLWKALQAASGLDSRLREYNFAELIVRAEQQLQQGREPTSRPCKNRPVSYKLRELTPALQSGSYVPPP